MFLESIKWWHSKHSRPTDLFLEGVKGFHFQMIFLIKIDRESPTFSSVEGLKLGFYRPLSTFLMEIFSSFCDYVFLFWWFSFAFTSLTFAPHKFSLCHRKCVLHFFFEVTWQPEIEKIMFWTNDGSTFSLSSKIPFWLTVENKLCNNFCCERYPFSILHFNYPR